MKLVKAYEVLGLSPGASTDEIKKAYRAKRSKAHPDKGGSTEAMAEINVANDILTGKSQAEEAQNTRTNHNGGNWAHTRWSQPAYDEMDPAYQAMYREMNKGKDIVVKISLSLEKVFTGCTYELEATYLCSGLKVKVPAGMVEGRPIKIEGKGVAPQVLDADPGDRLIFIQYEKHDIFNPNGLDIIVMVHIDLNTAIFGGSVVVPTLHGPYILKIPESTQGGTQLKMANKGMKRLMHNSYGDQICFVLVDIPKNGLSLCEEEVEQFQEGLSLLGSDETLVHQEVFDDYIKLTKE